MLTRTLGTASVDINRVQRWLILPFTLLVMVVGWRAARSPNITLLVVLGVAALAVAIVVPTPILLAPFVMVFAYWRVGPGAVDMSMTDATTTFAALAALPFIPWRDKNLRLILVALSAYLGIVAVAVGASFSVKALGELGHRGLLVAGAVLVGTAVARKGKTDLALRLFLGACVFLAVAAVVYSLTHGLRDAYPFGMHKNALGPQLASGLLIMLAAPRRLRLPREMMVIGAIVIVAGIFATQSRAAILGLTIVGAFYLIRHGGQRVRRIAPVLFVVGLALLAVAVVSFRNEQDLPAEKAKFNSVNTRLEGYDVALGEVWLREPIFGGGPKWFRLTAETSGAAGPHNIVIAELSETGLAGLVALLGLLGTTFVVLRRVRSDVATAARLVLAERILDSMLGIFWVAGTATLPFLVVGLAIGEQSQLPDDRDASAGPLASRH